MVQLTTEDIILSVKFEYVLDQLYKKKKKNEFFLYIIS